MPAPDSPARRQWSALSVLAWPAILTQLGVMAIGVVDTLMVSRVGVGALAGCALGNVVWIGLVFVSTGIIRGIDPFVSQAHGGRDARALSLVLQRGLVVAVLLSLPLMAALTQTRGLLLAAGQDPALAEAAHRYVWVQILSVPFEMVANVLRTYLQGRTLVRPPMWNMVVANLVNVVANWALVFGHLGFDAMGLEGAGLASATTRVAACLALAAHVVFGGLNRGVWFGWERACLSPRALGVVLSVGAPVCIHLATEVWAFSGSALLAGRLGEDALAAHQIVLNMASLTFMVPLGVSIAASARVGNLIGGDQREQVRQAIRMALVMGVGAMACFAVGFILLRDHLGLLYTSSPPVLALCASLLPIVAAFQIMDGTQVVVTGVLRGMASTRVPAIINVTAYWVFALPLGWWMAFHTELGVRGIWWALAAGVTYAAIFLLIFLAKMPVATRAPTGDVALD